MTKMDSRILCHDNGDAAAYLLTSAKLDNELLCELLEFDSPKPEEKDKEITTIYVDEDGDERAEVRPANTINCSEIFQTEPKREYAIKKLFLPIKYVSPEEEKKPKKRRKK